jgi:SEC-C motif-containing protein
MARKKPIPCPCGSGQIQPDCCAPYLAGTNLPPTAEALMRSRYTAYALGDLAYLRVTWHASTRPAELTSEPGLKWVGLQILATEGGDQNATEGWVEFIARYKIQGRAFLLHERSRFMREDGLWRYVDGVLDPE